jgi:hypothetical protein
MWVLKTQLKSHWVEAAEKADSLEDIINTSFGYFGYDNPIIAILMLI